MRSRPFATLSGVFTAACDHTNGVVIPIPAGAQELSISTTGAPVWFEVGLAALVVGSVGTSTEAAQSNGYCGNGHTVSEIAIRDDDVRVVVRAASDLATAAVQVSFFTMVRP